MTKRNMISAFRNIAKDHGLKIRFRKSIPYDFYGFADLDSSEIFIDKSTPKKILPSLFFHELGHFINMWTGKFPLYHTPNSRFANGFPPEFLRIAWRAERYTDKVGKKLMKTYFPLLRYVNGYTVGDKKSLIEFYKD